MKAAGKIVTRIVLMLVAGAAAVLLIEGALSLFAGQSLRSRPLADITRFIETDDQRIADSASLPGVYRFHKDPLVGFVLRQGENMQSGRTIMTSDNLGMRVRPGPRPPRNATRIVVLGDSVAFGSGLKDDETIACHLERVLEEVRGPDAEPVVCRTVAMPGWNHRNAVHGLFDHFPIFDPHIVIYMPIPNDLTDTLSLWTTGRRRLAPDVAVRDPWLPINLESLFAFMLYFRQRVDEGLVSSKVRAEDMGATALSADLSPESRRRYEDNVDSIAFLAEYLGRLDRKLMIMHYVENVDLMEYVWVLRERMLDRGLDIPEVPVMMNLAPALKAAPGDPHPSSLCAKAIAIWAAEEILKRGWVSPGAGNPLPEVPEEAAERRVPARGEEEIRKKVRELKEEALSLLQDEVNLETCRGFRQIFGGLNPDGSLNTRMLVLLKRAGPFLHVKLGAIPNAPQLYPLQIRVEVDGTPAGRITVPPLEEQDVVEERFPLQGISNTNALIEVRLVPDHWVMHPFKGKSYLAACRVISIACPAP